METELWDKMQDIQDKMQGIQDKVQDIQLNLNSDKQWILFFSINVP